MANSDRKIFDLNSTAFVEGSVGSVEGIPFTACTSGTDIIILASNFSTVQQINTNSQISSLDCSTDCGKIAAAYDSKMVIFEPIPLVQPQQAPVGGPTKLDYKWSQTATIESSSPVLVMSFNLEGNRLVAGGHTLQLWVVEGTSKTNWQCVWRCKTSSTISYLKFSPDGTLFCSASKSDRLVKIWYESVTSASISNCGLHNEPPATTLSTPNCLSPPPTFNNSVPVFTISSSSNNLHTSGQVDQTGIHPTKSRLEFSFIYIAHPLPITGLEWRRTSKYTPRGAVANTLITSCKDNIARIWVQTLLPDDGLVNFNQLKNSVNPSDLVPGAPRVHSQRHGQKLLRRLKRMKAFSQFKKRQVLELDHSINELEHVAANNSSTVPIEDHPILQTSSSANNLTNHIHRSNTSNDISSTTHTTSIPTALSAHDFHSYSICTSVIKPGLHFHLAGIIESDQPAPIPSQTLDRTNTTTANQTKSNSTSSCEVGDDDGIPPFVVHWVNNKDIHITRSIELLLHEMLIRILRGNNPNSSTNSPQSAGESCSGSENDTDDLDDANDDTITAESSKKLRHKLCRKMNKQRALAASGRRDVNDTDDVTNRNALYPSNGRSSPTSLVEEFDKTLESLLKKWQISSDLLFSIDKSDGTLTLWQVKYLDGEDTGIFRQVQIERLSRLSSALPYYDAITMSLNVIAYSPSAYLDVKRAFLAVTSSSGLGGSSNNSANFIVGDQFSPVDVPELLSINTESAVSYNPSIKNGGESISDINKDSVSASSIAESESSIFIVTQHLSGIMSLWKLNFSSTYPKVQSIDLITKITGLPIDPSWLRDGLLEVEYINEGNLVTRWIADELNKKTQVTIYDDDSRLQAKSAPDTQISNDSVTHNSVSSERADSITIPPQSSIDSQYGVTDSYRVSKMASELNVLPQYHLKHLIELLEFGKLQRVKAILNHLVTCLIALETQRGRDLDSHTSSGHRKGHRSRTLSIVAQSPASFQDSFDLDTTSSTIQQHVVEELELDYIEVTSLRPLPLFSLLEADTEKTNAGDSKNTAHEDFATGYESIMKAGSQVDQTLDEILGQSTIETINKQKELTRLASDAATEGNLTSFNPKKAKLLTSALTHTHLPGLSNIDQMHLLAVADAVALFDASPSDLNELYEEESYDSSHGGVGMVMSTNIAIDSLDDRGLRFLTAMRQHVYLSRCLPMKQRNELKATGIGNQNLVWAFHSESQDELISLIPCVQRNKPDWSELREFGIGWWLKKLEVLRKLIEKVAQSAYQARQDPLDAALFYLAMKKKTLICALLRRVNCDKRLLKLFEQDFNDPVNRKKALKNAYALLGLHRFEHAAAFFILAGSIWDAVEVCINNLNDIQLAMVLIRLHDNDSNLPSNLKKLLFSEVLGQQAHQDAFLRSMAFWKLGDYLAAARTLLDVGKDTPTGKASISASVFKFYLFLKDQPLVVMQKQQEQQSSTDEVLAEKLFFSTAQAYLEAGCPLLALEVLCSENMAKAQRMKFIACLHIIMNELNTLATCDSGKTTTDFLDWLQRSVEAIKKVCPYVGSEEENSDAWIKANEPILKAMLTYCNLHGLITVRARLLDLLSKKV